jgi:hypothetical protein
MTALRLGSAEFGSWGSRRRLRRRATAGPAGGASGAVLSPAIIVSGSWGRRHSPPGRSWPYPVPLLCPFGSDTAVTHGACHSIRPIRQSRTPPTTGLPPPRPSAGSWSPSGLLSVVIGLARSRRHGRRPLCGRRLPRRRLLLHVLYQLRQPRRHYCPGPDRHLHGPRPRLGASVCHPRRPGDRGRRPRPPHRVLRGGPARSRPHAVQRGRGQDRAGRCPRPSMRAERGRAAPLSPSSSVAGGMGGGSYVSSVKVPPKMSEFPNVAGHWVLGPGRSAVECEAGSSAACSRSSGSSPTIGSAVPATTSSTKACR